MSVILFGYKSQNAKNQDCWQLSIKNKINELILDKKNEYLPYNLGIEKFVNIYKPMKPISL